jgi:hypothetical protein
VAGMHVSNNIKFQGFKCQSNLVHKAFLVYLFVFIYCFAILYNVTTNFSLARKVVITQIADQGNLAFLSNENDALGKHLLLDRNSLNLSNENLPVKENKVASDFVNIIRQKELFLLKITKRTDFIYRCVYKYPINTKIIFPFHAFW